MSAPDNKPSGGEMVVLTSLPPGLLDGLPQVDQNAIVAIVGKPVLLVGYDEDGRAELQFDDPFDVRTDHYSHSHSIWVAPEFVERYGSNSRPVKPHFATAASTAGCAPPQPALFGP